MAFNTLSIDITNFFMDDKHKPVSTPYQIACAIGKREQHHLIKKEVEFLMKDGSLFVDEYGFIQLNRVWVDIILDTVKSLGINPDDVNYKKVLANGGNIIKATLKTNSRKSKHLRRSSFKKLSDKMKELPKTE